MQTNAAGRESVDAFEPRQLKAAEKNYPFHDKELHAMKYALVKFRFYLLGSNPFVVYMDHASLRTVTQSPHLSQRMARWLSFLKEYNSEVEYKPGKQSVSADSLSLRPDYELTHVTTLPSPREDLIIVAYPWYSHVWNCFMLLAVRAPQKSNTSLSPRLLASLSIFRRS